MKSYSSKFFDEISDGLKRIIVTRGNGKELSLDDALEEAMVRVKKVQDQNGLMFFCGNGASCSMAEHMSHDWFQNAKVNTTSCSATSYITAISNDTSFADVFSYRVERILSEKDVLVTISSSGNSPNIVKAIKAAKDKGAYIITLSGMRDDNKSRTGGDLNFYVPLKTYGLVESVHAILLHLGLDLFLDKYMGGRH